jgi:O-antigen/teichoic acid export membrane protein
MDDTVSASLGHTATDRDGPVPMTLLARAQVRLQSGVLRSVSWSFASVLVAKVAVLAINLVAIALLPPDGFGRFVTLQAAALLGATVWDLGVSSLLTREVAAGRIRGNRLVAEVSRLRLITLGPAVAVLACGVYVVGGTQGVSSVAILASAAYMLAFGSQLALQSALRGHFRFREVATGTIIGRIGAVMTLLAALILGGSDMILEALLVSLAVGEMLTSAIALRQLRSVGERQAPESYERVLTLHRSAPFAATSLMFVGYNRFDVVLIATLSSATVVGLYGPASRLQDMMVILPTIVEIVLLPYASRFFAMGQAGVAPTRSLWLRLTGVSVGISVAAAFLITYLAPTWIPRILGERYGGSIAAIQIIVWSVPFIAFNSALAAVISGRHQARYVTFGVAGALAAIVATDLVVVPIWGAAGAALGATVRELPFAFILLVGARASGLFGRGDA